MTMMILKFYMILEHNMYGHKKLILVYEWSILIIDVFSLIFEMSFVQYIEII